MDDLGVKPTIFGNPHINLTDFLWNFHIWPQHLQGLNLGLNAMSALVTQARGPVPGKRSWKVWEDGTQDLQKLSVKIYFQQTLQNSYIPIWPLVCHTYMSLSVYCGVICGCLIDNLTSVPLCTHTIYKEILRGICRMCENPWNIMYVRNAVCIYLYSLYRASGYIGRGISNVFLEMYRGKKALFFGLSIIPGKAWYIVIMPWGLPLTANSCFDIFEGAYDCI